MFDWLSDRSINRTNWTWTINRTQSNAKSQSNAIEYYPEIGRSIAIRLRLTIESQLFDRVRLRSIGSIAIFVQSRSIDIVWIWFILETFPLAPNRVLKLIKIFTADSVSYRVYHIHEKFKKSVERRQKSFWFSKIVIIAMAKNHDFDSIITSQCKFINLFNTANFWVALRFMAK